MKSLISVDCLTPAELSVQRKSRLINAPTWKNVSKSSSPVQLSPLTVFDRTVISGLLEKSSDASGIPSINVIVIVKL